MAAIDLPHLIDRRRGFIGVFSARNIGPTVHANVEVDMGAALGFRKGYLARYPGARLTVNDLIIKAAANALTHHRLYTWAYNGLFGLYPADEIDIRFPVDLGDDLGWGMVREADAKPLWRIAEESRASIERTRQETPRRMARIERLFRLPLVPRLVTGAIRGVRQAMDLVPSLDRWVRLRARRRRGTFLITNVGPAGIQRMEGPIVAPDILHLMIAATRPIPRLVEGRVETHPMMPLIAKFDHRMTDVAPVSRFLHEVRANLEAPQERLGPYEDPPPPAAEP